MPSGQQFKIASAIPKKIIQINPERDGRVRLIGIPIDKGENFLVLDDGSSNTTIWLKPGMKVPSGLIRVFARVEPNVEGFELRAEIIQDMKNLDLELYKRVMG